MLPPPAVRRIDGEDHREKDHDEEERPIHLGKCMAAAAEAVPKTLAPVTLHPVIAGEAYRRGSQPGRFATGAENLLRSQIRRPCKSRNRGREVEVE